MEPKGFSGLVVPGDGRGRELGFPTANLVVEEVGDLPRGVFAAKARINDGQSLSALVNIGTRPTFSKKKLAVELHILDFSGDVYGDLIAVTLLKKLRNERAFNGPQELVAQIRDDIHQARALFARGEGTAKH